MFSSPFFPWVWPAPKLKKGGADQGSHHRWEPNTKCGKDLRTKNEWKILDSTSSL
jgi:hypothetical protein